MIAATLVLSSSALVQAQSKFDWIDRQSGASPSRCAGASCLVDASGNVYASGGVDLDVFNLTYGDARLVKYAPDGSVLWSKTRDQLGGYDVSVDLAFGAGGVIHELAFCGAPGGPRLGEVFTWDPSGNLLWSTFLPDGVFAEEMAVSPQGQIVCGSSLWPFGGLVALSGTGQIQWHLAPLGEATGNAAADAQGDWYVHYHVSGGPSQPVRSGVAKVSSQGQLLWSHEDFGNWGADLARIAVAPDGYSVAVGFNQRTPVYLSMYAAAHDAAGTRLWSHSLPGTPTDIAYDVAIDEDGVAWVVGMQFGTSPMPTLVVARYSRSGALLSTSFRPVIAPMDLQRPRIVLGSAGQAYVLSWNHVVVADLHVLEVDSSGASTWSALHPGVSHGSLFLADFALGGNGKLAVTATEGDGSVRSMVTFQLDLNDAPQAYCVAKVNSLGCSPKLVFAGQSSAAATSGFQVISSQTLPSKAGLFLYSTAGKAAVPFQGGTLCLLFPLRRTPGSHSTSGTGCQSTRSIDFNAFASGTIGGYPVPELKLPGTAVHCQAWSRDPGFPAPNATSLSNALRYVVLP